MNHFLLSLGQWDGVPWIVGKVEGDGKLEVELAQTPGGSSPHEVQFVEATGERREAVCGSATTGAFFTFLGGCDLCLNLSVRSGGRLVGVAHVLPFRAGICKRIENVPLISTDGVFVAELRLAILICRPFSGIKGAPIPKWIATGVHIGHRGFGSTKSRHGVAENTLTAFLTAFRLGLKWVEFDVQISGDKVPILFHDHLISIKGGVKCAVDVISTTDLEEIQPRPPLLKSRRGSQVKRSSSNPDLSAALLEQFSVSDFSVFEQFPTLKKVLTAVPEGLGFNIELKYDDPENGLKSVFERNEFVDLVLACVAEHGGERHILFSSFDPDVVWLLRKKQSRYPVLFITETGNLTTKDLRRNSLESAIWWCTVNKLDGVVAEVERSIPQIASCIEKAVAGGLLVFTFGKKNSEEEVFNLQKESGKIHGIICDRYSVSKKMK